MDSLLMRAKGPEAAKDSLVGRIGNLDGHVVAHGQGVQTRGHVDACELGAPGAESLEAIPREAHAKSITPSSSWWHLEGVIEFPQVVA